jgi:hypothetical protein
MSPRADVARRMAGAAHEFLDALDADQRTLAHWPFPSEDERRRWFYTPTDHGGLPLGMMRPRQQRLALRFVATGLSRAGYVTVATIIGLENVLDAVEGWMSSFERERGRDPGLYYLRVFGDPDDDRWSWRFGGHHVSIHHLVLDREVVASTPCFLGADPAASPLLGPHMLRPLAGAEDLARDLVRSLDDEQRGKAIISPVAPVDLVGANRSRIAPGDEPLPLIDVWRRPFEGELGQRMRDTQARAEQAAGLTPAHLEAVRLSAEPKGVPVHALRPDQRDALRALLDVYLHRIPDELADDEAAKIAGDGLEALAFAWAGSTEAGAPHYYRVQGPQVLVEYDNTQRDVNHVHAVWRDPGGDFGDDVLAQHYRTTHHA